MAEVQEDELASTANDDTAVVTRRARLIDHATRPRRRLGSLPLVLTYEHRCSRSFRRRRISRPLLPLLSYRGVRASMLWLRAFVSLAFHALLLRTLRSKQTALLLYFPHFLPEDSHRCR